MPAHKATNGTPISPEKFSGLMSLLGVELSAHLATQKNIAVAVSGGGDSMALALLLAEWAADKDIQIHAITVDHGLRPEAADEAKFVAKALKPYGIKHKILKWEGKKPTTKIQELAREARYKLMTDYCAQKKINHLFLAHHGQDQIETILFRMAKGTGMDGLIGMRPIHILDNSITLLRPLLPVSHSDLIATLNDKKVEWIEDPSNENYKYARVRIRNTIDALEKEGLTPERMMTLSSRIDQSIQLIDYLIDSEYKRIILYIDTQRIEINYKSFLSLPHDGKTRILKRMISDLHPHKKYPARLEDIERLTHKMTPNFKGATLGGCLFKKKKETLIVQIETV